MFECEYCKKSYANQSCLNTHKKSAKFCIKMREETGVERGENHNYICSFCNKDFSVKRNLNCHLDKCKSKIMYYELESLREKFRNMEIENENNAKQLNIVKQQYSDLEDKYNKLCNDIRKKEELELQNSRNDYKELVEKLASSKSSSSTHNGNNNNKIYNHNYSFHINERFEKLPEFNKENVCNSLTNLLTHQSILQGTYETNMIKGIKDMVIVTDSSRDKLLIKENGLKCKTNSQEVIRNTFKYYDENNQRIFQEAQENMPEYSLQNAEEVCKKWGYLNELTVAAKDCKEEKQNDFIKSMSHSLSQEVQIQPSRPVIQNSSSA